MRIHRFVLLCLPAAALAGTAAHLNTAAKDEGIAQQVKWLEATLDDEDAAANQAVFPEGELFTWEFYALGLFNVAEQTKAPADVDRAIRVARAVLPKMDAMLTHAPFSKMKGRALRGGICWFAGQNLVRARLIGSSGGGTPDEVARFHADSALLSAEFGKSKTAVLEAHPGQSWPVDSLFGFESLQLHDRLYGTAYFPAPFAKWVKANEAVKDAKTGLYVAFMHLDGRARDVPRGCALSWSLAVLPRLDPTLAAVQWAAYKQSFFSCTAGVCLVREYPPGVERGPDVDSGPMFNGFGMSATAFALAAARANGDGAMATSLERLGESFGSPVVTAEGKRYLDGTVPMFDVLSLWVRTVSMPLP